MMNWPRPFAIFLATCLHAGAFYALWSNHVSEDMALESGEGAGEANVVATVNLDTGDLFDQTARQASQASEASKKEREPLKKDETTALRPEESEREDQEKPRPSERPNPKSAALASAGSQAQDAQQASAAVAAHREKLLAAYQIQLHEALERAKKHIHAAQDADVLLAITIAPSGQLLSSEVLRSSGIEEADRAAIASTHRAAPFPPMPPKIGATAITFRVPYQFRVR